MELKNVKTNGVVCDNPQCDWKNESVDTLQMALLVNHPCPKCGQNILTADDYIGMMQVIAVAENAPESNDDNQKVDFSVKVHNGITVFKNIDDGSEKIVEMERSGSVPQGIIRIMTERGDQLYKHKWTVERDSKQLPELECAILAIMTEDINNWPSDWNEEVFAHIIDKSRVEQMTIIGALAAAWIDGHLYQEQTI